MASNSIRRNPDGIVVVVESGYQTAESLKSLNQQVVKEVKRLHAASQPALIFSDLTHITGHDKGAEAEAIQAMRIPFDAMAVYTTSRADRMMITMLVTLHDASERVRTFRTSQDAYAWLETFK
jgi:hypothetical protein